MKPAAWTSETLAALAVAPNPFGKLASIEEIMQGAHLYSYERGAVRVLVAVRPVTFSGGTRLDLMGLRSLGNRLNRVDFFAALDRLGEAYGAQIMGCCTQVPHVADYCTKSGYSVTGAILTKNRI